MNTSYMCEKGNKNPEIIKWEINSNILFTQHNGNSPEDKLTQFTVLDVQF
jgi:hypothetical protein